MNQNRAAFRERWRTVSRIETGTTNARISTVRKLAEVLDVDPADILAADGPPGMTARKRRQSD